MIVLGISCNVALTMEYATVRIQPLQYKFTHMVTYMTFVSFRLYKPCSLYALVYSMIKPLF